MILPFIFWFGLDWWPGEVHLHHFISSQSAEPEHGDIFQFQIDIHRTLGTLNNVNFVDIQRIQWHQIHIP